MRKFTKLLVCTACVATIGTGSLFAKGRGGMGNNRGQDGFGNGRMKFVTDENGNITQVRPTDLLGQVSSVDEKKGTIKILDLDGKEIVLSVNPFTHIRLYDSTSEKTISDIKKGDWIMYNLFNTETENKVACRILVKSN